MDEQKKLFVKTMSSDNKYGRQDSDTSGSSSIVDSPIYTRFTGKLLSPHDMEFQRCKLIFFNAALHSYNARAFAIVETVDDVKYALKYCQEHGVSIVYDAMKQTRPWR